MFCLFAQGLSNLPVRKALDNNDLNQMSRRYVSGVLQNDWNDPFDFRAFT